MESEPSLPWHARRALFMACCFGLLLLWVVDLESVYDPAHRWTRWLPSLFSGPLAAAALVLPHRRPAPEWRAAAAALGSLVLTALMLFFAPLYAGLWGVLESMALLVLLARTVRRVERPATAAALAAALSTAIICAPLRVEWDVDSLLMCYLLTFATVAALGLGVYVRTLDTRRARAVQAVRQGERLELARELHDFVAHHVTGIIVQAQAAETIHRAAPAQIEPILHNIQESGAQTLDSMRRLVRVLREGDARSVRPGEVLAELARLVSDFSDNQVQARLDVSAGARAAHLAPEVETSLHRVVQEALTNVRRHACGTRVTVRLDVDDASGGEPRFLLSVRNTAPRVRRTTPAGGKGGFGLVGLRERVEVVGGTLRTGATDEGGWEVAAAFPLLGSVTGSNA